MDRIIANHNFFEEDEPPAFESSQWTRNRTMEQAETPAITPGFLSGANEVDETGSPILSKITFGVHWTSGDFPAWTGNQISRDAINEQKLSCTPSALMATTICSDHETESPSEKAKGNKFAPPFGVSHIAAMTDQVRETLGFQFDVALNVFELLMSQLDSRASRSCPRSALRQLHSEYISGAHANFRKWYFASQMDLLDRELEKTKAKGRSGQQSFQGPGVLFAESKTTLPEDSDQEELSLSESEAIWELHNGICSDSQKIVDLIIYLLCWTEANQVRFMPECLAFIVKCCRDYYFANFTIYPVMERKTENLSADFFLTSVINPIYNCYRSYNYTLTESGEWIRREGDHKDIIGYDDMNQLFWYSEGLKRIRVVHAKEFADGKEPSGHDHQLISLNPETWLLALEHVDWTNAFFKTYRESRTWLHNITNFSRIWILHASVFWFYTSFNTPSLYTSGYNYMNPKPPRAFVRFSIMSLGGLCGPLVTLVSLLGELRFVPRKYPGAKPIMFRFLIVLLLCLLLGVPAICNLLLNPWQPNDLDLMPATVISCVLFALAILYTLYFSFQPLESVIGANPIGMRLKDANKVKRRFLANEVFTASFAKRNHHDTILSWMMCILTFSAKFTESYFFLTLSVRDPLRELGIMNLEDQCGGDMFLIGALLCRIYPKIILIGIIVTDLTLFFLDTYLWYVIFNTLISVSIAFKEGTSIWTPWRNVYSRLPQRITAKLLAPSTRSRSAFTRATALRIVWNSIVDSMHRSNLLSREQALKLIYVNDDTMEPRFFTMEEDGKALESACGASNAYRRILFFAQSLSTPMQPAVTVQEMPSFTVIVPHYKEKMVLALSETIKADMGAKITVLEYLQGLYPQEWENLVHELQLQGNNEYQNPWSASNSGAEAALETTCSFLSNRATSPRSFNSNSHQIALRKLGFFTLDPNDTGRTQLWCSERTQTLYRTLKGFSNYNNALRVLCCAEDTSDVHSSDQAAISEISDLCSRKFRLLVAMQLYAQFTADELQQVETILSMVPDLTVSYVEKDSSTGEYFSCVFDNSCPLLESGRRKPRMRIKLSGDPFLGDGKSDNQNSALPFYRGEYIQLVDANQDNYMEECLKIRNILMEFESSSYSEVNVPVAGTIPVVDPALDPESRSDFRDLEAQAEMYNQVSILSAEQSPVAIVGAREYILSENIGVLGDVAAGKEQTFGTLFSRTLARIGAKLHYGHPDFLNAIFMTTRGGVSKGQRGLHLNEDIYAGMTAILRGGKIRHSEYFQCGKGRDLGFISILNFTAKIGAGMGEQMLSREYFYMGTQLPFDRFISFYYAHPGFHLNNAFIMLSLEMLLMVMLWIASIASVSTSCVYSAKTRSTTPHSPEGCVNVLALVDWIRRCVVSIFLVFFVSLCPLFFQELTEKGFIKSLTRAARHFASLSMLFEVFACRIYARSFWEDMNIGGAKYVATGRGLATTRSPFYALYSGYYPEILCGIKAAAVVWYASITFWNPSYLWFWVTTISLCICPILYNPHQFAFTDFFVDYNRLIIWFWNATSSSTSSLIGKHSWISFNREVRKKLTGVRDRVTGAETNKPTFRNAMISQVGSTMLIFICLGLPYVYVGTQKTHRHQEAPETSALLRLIFVSLIPIGVNTVVAAACCVVSAALHLFRISKHANVMAMVAHTLSLFSLIFSWWILYVLESRQFSSVLLGIAVTCSLHHLMHTLLAVILFRRQRNDYETNDPWWSGDWDKAKLGWRFPFVFAEELIVKSTVEPLEYAYDFLACHIILSIQIPFLMIPFVDKLHTFFLMWLRPSVTAAASRSVSVQRKRHLLIKGRCFCALLIFNVTSLALLMAFPFLAPKSWLELLENQLDRVISL